MQHTDIIGTAIDIAPDGPTDSSVGLRGVMARDRLTPPPVETIGSVLINGDGRRKRKGVKGG